MRTLPCRLLLVDDDPSELKLMKLTLEGHGHTVITAQNGHEALQVMPHHPVDGVISDVLMPHLDGYQLCRALRQDHRYSHLPIVLFSSAVTDPRDLRLAQDVGAQALLARTPNVQHLARQAVEVLQLIAGMKDSLPATPSAEDPLRPSQERLHLMTEQLRHAQKLASIGQIAAGVAHELNNPLTAILGFIECLIRQPDAPDIVNVLQTMQREGSRCRKLIQDMLTFTRKSGTQAARESLPQLADGILGLIEARAKTMRVAIEKHYEDSLPLALVHGDQIQQVLINLCSNALDAMPKGGTLSITIGLTGNDFILRVRDTGEGMSPEQTKRIFEPFFTTKEAGKGTGLGLSLVQDIVTTHKGHVEVQSAVGQGTTFNVILPLGETPS